MHKSRIAGLAALGGLVAVFAGAAPAMADVDSLTCAFSGAAGIANPGVPSILDTSTLPPTVQTGGAGSFGFAGQGTCALVDTDLTVGVGTANISASGGYGNILCGTGTASGTGTITPGALTAGTWGGHTSASADFTIVFVAGQGAMVLTNATDVDSDDTAPDTVGAGAGYVNIVPDALNGGGDCIVTNVSNFNVTGAFTAAIA